MVATQALLLLLLATTVGIQVGTAVNIYIKPAHHPSINVTCTENGRTCVTLEQLKINSSALIPNGGNVTLFFLGGVHILKYFSMQHLSSLIIESASSQIATIQYFRQSTQVVFNIKNVSTVTIRKLKFVSIGSPSIIRISTANLFIEDIRTTQFIIKIIPDFNQSENTTTASLHLVNCFLARSSFKVGEYFYVRQLQLSIVNCTFSQSINSAINIHHAKKNSKNNVKAITIHITKVRIIDTLKYDAISINLYFLNFTATAFIDISHSVIEYSKSSGVYVNANEGFQDMQITLVNNTISFQKHLAIEIIHFGRVIKTNVEKCLLDNNYSGIRITSTFKKEYVKSKEDSAEMNIHETVIRESKDVGMLLLGYFKNKMKVNVTNCVIKNATVGSIIRAKFTKSQYVNFRNTTISHNQNGGLKILSTIDCQWSDVLIYNCTICNNHLSSIANRAIGPKQSVAGLTLWFVQEESHSIIEKAKFLHNHDRSTQSVIFQVVNLKQITIKDCEFAGNHGSPIRSYFGQITFIGHNIFKQNRAFDGGALSLLHSRIIILENTQIDFTGNHAERVGGAIFVKGLPKVLTIEATERCFYQLPSVHNDKSLAALNSTINFYNNTAEIGGEDIYGAPLKHSCYVSEERKVKSYKVAAANVFRFYSLSEKYFSSISSDPERVCLCDEHGTPQCANMSYIIQQQTRFPGEKFNVSAVLVGDEFGTVSGTVYATLLQKGQLTYRMDSHQWSQEVTFKKCNFLRFSIQAATQQETLILTASKVSIDEYADLQRVAQSINRYIQENKYMKLGIHSSLLSQPIYINITLEDCPVGFQLDPDLLSCECSKELLGIGIENCKITNHTGLIHRYGTIWITAIPNETSVVAHEYCPYHYCKSESLLVDPTVPDAQCSLNHSGVLCGGCLANYSLTIGGNRCLSCQNSNGLSLIIFFIAAGFLLVFFIKILDLTVTKGTINGLIFYANVAWAYKSILFPPDIVRYPFLQFLQVFLAWLNLDFGIETCFVVGLTAYWKTWLQFLFPFYVWMIVGIMILLSRYSTKVTNILGNNTVPVLATLFLLSYAKLVRTIITVLGFSVLRYRGHIVSTVWSFDGNLAYFGVEHSFLMLVALLATLLLWLPYVFTLTAVSFLKRISHHFKCLRWISSWKPFYDAYFGPLKDKHHYWVGLLLIIRGGLLLLFSISSTSYPNVTILVMIITSSLISLYTSFLENVYKKKSLGLSENFALVNLIFLGSGILCVTVFDGPKSIIVQISIGLAFGQFLCIVMFHIWSALKVKCWKKMDNNLASRVQCDNLDDTWTRSLDHLHERHDSWRGSFTSNQLRESLIQDSSY